MNIIWSEFRETLFCYWYFFQKIANKPFSRDFPFLLLKFSSVRKSFWCSLCERKARTRMSGKIRFRIVRCTKGRKEDVELFSTRSSPCLFYSPNLYTYKIDRGLIYTYIIIASSSLSPVLLGPWFIRQILFGLLQLHFEPFFSYFSFFFFPLIPSYTHLSIIRR